MSLNVIAWHDRTSSNHLQELTNAAANGYRTLSLSIYGDPSAPLYAAVMIKRPQIIATEQHIAMNSAQFQAKFNEMSAKGWGPYLVSATGPAGNPLIAACFTPVTPTPLTRFDITAETLRQINNEQMLNGGMLRSVDAYGEPGNIRYIAVWYPNVDRVAWNCDGIEEEHAIAQQRFNAVVSAGGRPSMVVSQPGDRLLQFFVDTTVGAWNAQAGMTSQGYQETFNKNAAQGLWPVQVSAHGSGAATRFAAVFCDRETPHARVFQAKGPTTVAKIDTVISDFMKAHGLRQASLAVTKGTRLVYTKGYTWAEPGYPEALPTTSFRQASVSKMIAAVAMYQIMEMQPQKYTLDTTVQSILNLKAPAGMQIHPDFNKITLRHLLESTSSLDRNSIWQDVATANELGGTSHLPVNAAQLAAHIATLPLESSPVLDVLGKETSKIVKDTPGNTKNVKYNNTGYFILSQVVAKIRGAASFEAAITPSLLKPLGITRTRESHSLRSAQLNDEARYQLTARVWKEDKIDPNKITGYDNALVVGWSVRTPEQPLVPVQYGTFSSENHDGAGGLSAAVTDIARFVAMFSSGTANPVLKQATVTTMLKATTNCHLTYSGPKKHGFHGFDWALMHNEKAGVFEAAKGGYLPGNQCGFHFTTGGYGYIICIAGNAHGPNAASIDWEAMIRPIVESNDWKDTNLFTDPQIGMSPLVPVAKKAVEIKMPAFDVSSNMSIDAAIKLHQHSPVMHAQRPVSEPSFQLEKEQASGIKSKAEVASS